MSETITSLRRQINVTHDLQSVVKTMRALAAVNIRQYQQAVEALESYRETIAMGFQIIIQNQPTTIARFDPDVGSGKIVVVVGSDQGLVGQFNQHVVQYAQEQMEEEDAEPLMVCAVGMRLPPYLEDVGYEADIVLPVPGESAGITPTVRDLLLQIASWRKEYQIDRLSLFYNRPTRQASYEPENTDLLPLNPAWFAELRQRPWQSRSIPTSRVEWRPLFKQLIQQHFFASMYFSLASSLASENASRLASMENAQDNIEDRLNDLQQRYNRHRQQSITEELFDVIAGFEMLR